jgi:hypothetical protein
LVLLTAVAVVASVGYVRTQVALKGEAEQRAAAQAVGQELRQHLYAARINLMQEAWDTGQMARLRALLAETEDYPDRGFEWYYWQRLRHLELLELVDGNSVGLSKRRLKISLRYGFIAATGPSGLALVPHDPAPQGQPGRT